MHLAATLDQVPKPVWIGLVILAFWHWWPLGLALLAFLIWSGRMGCLRRHAFGHWHNHREGQGGGCGPWGGFRERRASSGNRAFDEYRADTLRRLEEEQREFLDFLERLRAAKDKAEFDDFLAERRRRAAGPEPQPPG